MVAYAIFLRERLRDPDRIDAYYQRLPAAFEGQAIVRRVGHGALEMLEGAAVESVVVLEFPSLDAARAWYESPAYRAARHFRHLAADYRVLLVEGAQSEGQPVDTKVQWRPGDGGHS